MFRFRQTRMEGEQERVRVGEDLSPVGQAFLPVAFSLAWAKSADCGRAMRVPSNFLTQLNC
jgi:hypothetical protein